jgi:hypothetical protein
VPAWLPHCFCARRPEMAAVVVLPLSIAMMAGAWVSWRGGFQWLDAMAGIIFGLLTIDAVRRVGIGEKGGIIPAGPADGGGGDDEESVDGAPYLLVKAPEHDLLLLEAESSLREMVERTPIRGLRIASAEAVGTVVRMLPGAEIVPWTAGFNEAIMEEYSRLVDLHREKIAEAMAADSSRMAAELDNDDLSKKLSEALEANKKYEAVLQDLRSRPVQAQADYSKMTPSQRGEEERRLREGLSKLQEIGKAGRLEPVSIPSHFRQIGKL